MEQKEMSKAYAVDFDGTLCENRWPENIVVTRGENKRAVTVQLPVTPVNCMRQLYMTVVVE